MSYRSRLGCSRRIRHFGLKRSRRAGYRGAVHVQPASVSAAMAARSPPDCSSLRRRSPARPTPPPPTSPERSSFSTPATTAPTTARSAGRFPTGRGGTKDCQASGTSTDDGFPEHTFTWDTTLRIRQALTALGVRTACRAATTPASGPASTSVPRWPTRSGPNAVVSIHGDGGPPTGRGFHVLYSSPPLNAAQAGPSVQFARVDARSAGWHRASRPRRTSDQSGSIRVPTSPGSTSRSTRRSSSSSGT